MQRLSFIITGDVSLGGKRPGEVFTLKCDDAGVPLEAYWRRRLNDEALYGCGAVARHQPGQSVPPPPPPAPVMPAESEPPVKSASTRSKKAI